MVTERGSEYNIVERGDSRKFTSSGRGEGLLQYYRALEVERIRQILLNTTKTIPPPSPSLAIKSEHSISYGILEPSTCLHYLFVIDLHDQCSSSTNAVSKLFPIHGIVHRQIFIAQCQGIGLAWAATEKRASVCHVCWLLCSSYLECHATNGVLRDK